ncbi:SusD/RagB family nutrient-binding outer membrane lipoprotein [Fulvivirga sediminis]|uniref:SusD/RagB family nutrient-binding outer membrane lipoprotein n=1 Tax=Fulvivirga sediminis TaxID=2803949 RepID=A0A937F5Q3_9BACT|nr:SusD/RagB family nutrient-binding outer membrane lipoprotein [Fulvivirga sediminis]MBL3654795.1 SusD/RagB family nutrient-binding outer membrane lipoprotein [Fulvivirga sediminis]
MKKIIYILTIALFFIGCDDRLDDLNTDKRNPSSVGAESLFTQGLRETYDNMLNTSVNENVFKLYAQYWAQTTYPSESQFDLTSRNLPRSFWNNAYRDVLIDFKTAKDIIKEELASGESTQEGVLRNQLAVTNIMMSYVYLTLVDVFGDVPYTEALNPDNLTPVYDDAKTIYLASVDSLDAAIAAIDTEKEAFSATQDPVYDGVSASWVKFANSLKLRVAMRLADVDKTTSIAIFNSAVEGAFKSNADNASIIYYGSAPNTNPLYEDLKLSGRNDFVGSNTFINILNNLNDPRRSIYFAENLGTDTYKGGIYGSSNGFTSYSHIGDLFYTPDLEGTIFNYAEVEFLMAEAVARGGYNVTGSVEDHYNSGIKASFDQWGADGYENYVAQSSVAYASASGDYKQKIGVQLWIALYVQGFEAWNTWKRLDFAAFNAPPGKTLNDIPVRFIYPLNEAQLNGENLKAAQSKIGEDKVSTHLFWDVN